MRLFAFLCWFSLLLAAPIITIDSISINPISIGSVLRSPSTTNDSNMRHSSETACQPFDALDGDGRNIVSIFDFSEVTEGEGESDLWSEEEKKESLVPRDYHIEEMEEVFVV